MKKFIVGVVLGFAFFALSAGAESSLSQLDIMALTKPAIVKIYHQIGGKLSIPVIRMDIDTMNLSVDETYKSTIKANYVAFSDHIILNKFEEKLNAQTVYGTGFIINPDGYIVTNAHVASAAYLEKDYLIDGVQSIIDNMIEVYEKKYPGKLDKLYATEQEWAEIYDKLDASMMKLIIDNAKIDSKLIVIPQSSTDTTLEDIIRDGFEAKVVSMTDDFLSEKNQDKDLAVIKIEQKGLPTLKIDNTKSTQIGDKVFIWGYPSSAEFNEKDVIDPTLTQGIINAFKDSSDKSFKLLQTDAKISEGSSGSPILNSKGEVVGILTYSSADTGTAGDSFGWGLPAEFILQVMKNGSVENNTNYYNNFSGGISLLQERRCKKAIAKFNEVIKTNEKFPVDQQVRPYIDKCTGLINSGKSIDSIFSEIWSTITGFVSSSWALILFTVFAVAGLGFEIYTLKNENKKEEAEISKLETTVETHEKEIESLKSKNTPL